ncbi:hypothetical protein ACFE04_029895 [Oxalis oulophora]
MDTYTGTRGSPRKLEHMLQVQMVEQLYETQLLGIENSAGIFLAAIISTIETDFPAFLAISAAPCITAAILQTYTQLEHKSSSLIPPIFVIDYRHIPFTKRTVRPPRHKGHIMYSYRIHPICGIQTRYFLI